GAGLLRGSRAQPARLARSHRRAARRHGRAEHRRGGGRRGPRRRYSADRCPRTDQLPGGRGTRSSGIIRMKGIAVLQGFEEFISRGNAVDLAVGVVIGAAFGAVVTALVDNVLNPLSGGIFGQPNLDRIWVITLSGGGEPTEILFGAVLTA